MVLHGFIKCFAYKAVNVIGSFMSCRNSALHKGVDVMCDDYGNINAPFTGTLGGPVGRRGTDGIQFDGVKLSNSGKSTVLH